jgi:glutamate-1-semialdehyde 2,1-aminomutase
MSSESRRLQEIAHQLIPAGAHTYSRADDQYPINAPAILERGEGAFVWDADGNRFLDFGMALRSVTVGYGYRSIAEAAIKEIYKGNNLTRASVTEIKAAQVFTDLIPGAEMVKFAKNGSTVTSAAVKLARAYTGRKIVARCLQQPFFSYDDWFIGDTAMNAGVPADIRALTKNFNFNDIGSLERLFEEYPGEIAAVILEPMTTEEPKPAPELGAGKNFLHQIQNLCRKYGAVFIGDEMITGFRWHLKGACHAYGVVPDLLTFGKGMANGFSVAALAGKREIMELGGIKHSKERVFLISTTHGAEMCGLGAFIETMKVYAELDVVSRLWAAGRELREGIEGIARELGISSSFRWMGADCSPAFLTLDREGKVSFGLRTLFSQEMIRNGVLMPWVALAHAHGKEETAVAVDAARKALTVYARAFESGRLSDFLVGPEIKPVFRPYN